MTNRQPSPGGATPATPATPAGGRDGKPDAARTRFRSPYAVAVWWLWVLFAVGNLIDLAAQGRDHLSLVAAVILLLVTGILWVTAQRPRIVADDSGLEIVNPLRTHRIGWAAVAGVDATELVRVRCEWPEGKRRIYAWAVRSSRRAQLTAELRAQRRARRAGSGIFGGGAARQAPPTAEPDVEKVVAALTARTDRASQAAPDGTAQPPESAWYLPGFAAIAVPAVALLIAVLV